MTQTEGIVRTRTPGGKKLRALEVLEKSRTAMAPRAMKSKEIAKEPRPS